MSKPRPPLGRPPGHAYGRGGQSVRQLRLLRYLTTSGTWCEYTELAEVLGVGWRTVYRDIQALCAAGVPIEHDECEGRGWRLRKSGLLRWLTEPESGSRTKD